MRIVKLTRTDGVPVWVNADNVAYFSESGDQNTLLVFVGPADERTAPSLLVDESPAQVAALVGGV